jgi:hypothetical protein
MTDSWLGVTDTSRFRNPFRADRNVTRERTRRGQEFMTPTRENGLARTDT